MMRGFANRLLNETPVAATSSSSRGARLGNGGLSPPTWAVVCTKSSGVELEFNRYADERTARDVAKRLAELGATVFVRYCAATREIVET
jgi:hypothetical protein